MLSKQCCKCKEEKSISNFYNRKHSIDGKQSQCKECMATAYRTCRHKKLQHYNDIQSHRCILIRDQYREWKHQQGCACCNEDDPVCLHLHHLDPSKKEHAPASLITSSFNKLIKEAKKCIVVCGNCHAKIHDGSIRQCRDGRPVFLRFA